MTMGSRRIAAVTAHTGRGKTWVGGHLVNTHLLPLDVKGGIREKAICGAGQSPHAATWR